MTTTEQRTYQMTVDRIIWDDSDKREVIDQTVLRKAISDAIDRNEVISPMTFNASLWSAGTCDCNYQPEHYHIEAKCDAVSMER